MSQNNNGAFENLLKALLREAYRHDAEGANSAQDYQQSFANEGKRKVAFIKEDLQKLFDRKKVRAEDVVALSIGGADGSDVLEILNTTPITHGILLEYNTDAAQKARDAAVALGAQGKHLFVFEGDAVASVDKVEKKLNELKDTKKCLACICLGVLHELPLRSRGYTLDSFIARLGAFYRNFLFYASEPTVPENWPSKVQLKIGDATALTLDTFARYIRNNLWIDERSTPGAPEQVGDFVSLDRELAMEVLFKVVRRHSPQRHRYEMGERMTSFTVRDFEKCWRLMDGAQLADLTTQPMASEGFLEDYRAAKIKILNGAEPLLPPHSHIRIIGHRLNPTSLTSNPDLTPESQKPTPTLASEKKAIIESLQNYGISYSEKYSFYLKTLRSVERRKEADPNDLIHEVERFLNYCRLVAIPLLKGLSAKKEITIIDTALERMMKWNAEFVRGFEIEDPVLIDYEKPVKIITETVTDLWSI